MDLCRVCTKDHCHSILDHLALRIDERSGDKEWECPCVLLFLELTGKQATTDLGTMFTGGLFLVICGKQIHLSPFTFYRMWKEKPHFIINNYSFEHFLKYGRGDDVDEFAEIMLSA